MEAEAPLREAPNTPEILWILFRQRLAGALELCGQGRLHAWSLAKALLRHPGLPAELAPFFGQVVPPERDLPQVTIPQPAGKASQLLSSFSPGACTGF